MSSDSREKIMTSIKLALGYPEKDETICEPSSPYSPVNRISPDEPWDDLEKELTALSARFHKAATPEEARDIIHGILEEHDVKKAVLWEHDLLDSLKVTDLIENAGVQMVPIDPGVADFPQQTATAELGITAADAVLVDSGTIVVKAVKGEERSTSLLPPVHLAVITKNQRLQSVMDLPPLLRTFKDENQNLPSAFHLISGPSRTADIEFTLVLGAHGPKVLHVLALDWDI